MKTEQGNYATSGRGPAMLETIESPAVRRRFGGRLPRGLRFPWRGAELGAFREGEQSPVVMRRDTGFRRALATADAVALLVAFTSVVVLGGDRPAPTAGLLLALIVAHREGRRPLRPRRQPAQ